MLKAVPVPDDISPQNSKRHMHNHDAYFKGICQTLEATKKTLDSFEIQSQLTKDTLKAQLDIVEKVRDEIVDYQSDVIGMDNIKFTELLSCLRDVRTDLGMAMSLLNIGRKLPKRYFLQLNNAISTLERYLKKYYKK